MTKNEIDFIMTNKKHIVRDVSVINRFNTGSDHRLVRGSLNINFKAERFRLMKARLRPTLLQTMTGSEKFQSNLENRFAAVETTTDVNQNHEYVVRHVRRGVDMWFGSSGRKVRDSVTCSVRDYEETT
ncbi:hypothetical protein B5X24_HaOG207010 [Helicoverpa armigera]|nr:hypothetical protein B5X24_HaOG207010 [Helicoverpa armigera]